jgi:hypothetical protein
MELLEILKYLIPSVVVFATSYFSIYLFLNNETKKKQFEIKSASMETILPIKLQAYERLVLFLERISPNSLILRVHQSGNTALYFQTALINTIREEFEHNLSQQLYISSSAWELVKNAKEEVVSIINTAAAKLSENELASSEDLSRKIFEITIQMEKVPTATALEKLKTEIRQIF